MKAWLRSREAALAGLLVLLLAYAAWAEPRFVTVRAQTLLATHLWELAIVAIPMFLIIVSGGIDLSVGSMVALTAVTLGLLFERGVNPAVAAMIAIAVGTGLGAVNGWFVSRLKVHPLIVTLATMAAFRGVAEGISLARPISGYPPQFLNMAQGLVPPLIFFVLVLAAGLMLSRTIGGRWIVAIGTEETVAWFSGVPVARVKLALYALAGLLSGVAATLLVARNNTAKADQGIGLELEAITAVVLGGASIEGGKGKVVGLVLGLVLIHQTREFVSWHWKQNEINLIVVGLLLVASVLIERVLASRLRAS
ncbi:MAG: ABC transporter permease [Fimbriimonas sp.]